jgi:uncharacterized protein YcbK (DUF882 family)
MIVLTPHFTLDEFACRDGAAVPPELVPNVLRLALQLEVLRTHLGAQPIRILSGYRTAAHNARLRGAAKRSRHLTAEAADIVIAGETPRAIHAEIERLIAAGLMQEGGLGLYPRWVHYDCDGTGRRRRWGA